MRVIRPKILGILKVQIMMAGNFAVMNDIKNAPKKLIIPDRSDIHKSYRGFAIRAYKQRNNKRKVMNINGFLYF